jgi:cell division septation protein DedD
MKNKTVLAIFVGGVLLLLGIFWAGLMVTKDRGSQTPATQNGSAKSQNARPAPVRPTPTASAPDANTRYVVRVASFGTSQEANQLMQDLRTKYLSAYTQDPERGGKDTLYHVNIGPYDSREAAEQVAQELAGEGRKGVTILEQSQK